MKKALIGLFLIGLLTAPFSVQADVILAPGSDWEYTFNDPTDDLDWNTKTGGWAIGSAPFGNNTGGYSTDPAGYFDYVTLWEADGSDGDDLWVRTAIDLTGYDLSTAAWDLGVDNGFKLYANGSYIDGGNAEQYTFRWEYSGDFGAFLSPGVNIIAVALEDHGGLTAFDMQVTAAPVPEPATLFLLGTGLVGIGAVVRKKIFK